MKSWIKTLYGAVLTLFLAAFILMSLPPKAQASSPGIHSRQIQTMDSGTRNSDNGQETHG